MPVILKIPLNNTKIIQLLKTFTTAEMNDFGKFIGSPFFNESTKMKNLYSVFKKAHPDFSDKNFTKENIYGKIYGTGKYDDKKLRDRFSDLLKLAEEFLAMTDLRNNEVKMKRHTLNQYAARTLKTHFDKTYGEIGEKLKKIKVKNNHFFYDEYLHLKDRELPFNNEKVTLKRLDLYESMKTEIEYFLRFLVSKMLKYYTMTRSMEKHLRFEYDYSFYLPVLKYVEENDFSKYPSITAFYHLLKLGEDPSNEKIYFNLKKLIIRTADQLEQRDKILIFTELFNFAHLIFLSGNEKFSKERYEITKLEMKYRTYPVENGFMYRNTFMNFLQLALLHGTVAESEKVLKDHIKLVAEENRDDLLTMSQGLIAFKKRNYRLAEKMLSSIKIKSKDFHAYVVIRLFLAKAYYELGEFENLLTLIDAFKHYMTSNDMIPEAYTSRYMNFMHVLLRLTNAALEIDPDKAEFNIAKLKKDINGMSLSELGQNTPWLQMKIGELEKKFPRKRNLK